MPAIAETLDDERPVLCGEYSIRAGFAWDDEWIWGPVTLFVPLGMFYFVLGPWRLSVTWPVVLED